jgi:hypothetical protein
MSQGENVAHEEIHMKTTEEQVSDTQLGAASGTHKRRQKSKAKGASRCSPRKQTRQKGRRQKATEAKADLGFPRDSSKTGQILGLLRRVGGATTAELLKHTGWKSHSLRGFISGTVRKKMGFSVSSTKSESGDRTYLIEK